VEEYERIMRLASDAPEPLTPAPGEFRLAEIREHRRIYAAG
jgi:hydroxymethylglutaryl-CoA synthase